MNDILYAKANFTEFSLRTHEEQLEDDYMAEHVEEAFELLCPKCNENLTKQEYQNNKLSQTQDGRKVKCLGIRYRSRSMTGDQIVIYSMEHKRCSLK
ncbi:hypothetical protein GRF59_14970 [Paenibacillus sp. HJL G12]|uniref:Uncharacterized protein n=1 Tax=Paenibacillus dendrobii TaxID=2691084 RepID=A0A7X3IJ51_9BACL|nr:hypothetical protein [Paenibacillus dendrobii]MWV44922.1 hypothetical protein [Paenibacillus dendrobii]